MVYPTYAIDVAFATTLGNLATTRLQRSGQPIETLVISATATDERSAALVVTTTGHVLPAYTRVADELLYGGVELAFVAMPRPARARAAGNPM
jgi:hypothetical protein